MTTTAAPAAYTHARSPEHAALIEKYMSITAWAKVSGMSRSAIYRSLVAGDLKAVKVGRATKIDVEHGLRWMASLPAAEFRAPSAGKAAHPPAA